MALPTTDGKLFKLTTDGSQDNINAYYNAQTQQIDLASVSVQGGYMQLYGDIVSTGGGQINVLDGYGTVNITNNTSYAIVTNNVDTGHDVAGKLLITDTEYTATIDGQVLPLTTEYTRENGQVSVQSYYLESDGHTKIADPSSPTVLNAAPLTRSARLHPRLRPALRLDRGGDLPADDDRHVQHVGLARHQRLLLAVEYRQFHYRRTPAA